MTMIADYVVREQLREGNHGTVMLAEPPARLGLDVDIVALKILRDHADDDDFKRVANELRLLHSVQSPHLVTLLDAGSDRGRLFFVMPYYTAGALEHAAANMKPEQIRQCVADAARGAHALHEHGIAHRDIKPANLFVHNGRGVLGELGLAQMVGGGTTHVGAGPLGAMEYTAPDIIWGDPGSRQTDLWSLGMTLHRALTGRGALGDMPEESILAACRHVLHTRPQIDPSIDANTRAILDRCFATDTEQHFHTALDFADALAPTDPGAHQ